MSRPADLSDGRAGSCRPGRESATSAPHTEQIPVNPKHYHMPLSPRLRCPVCHEAVYSRAGIHPQCAVRQFDPPKSKSQPQVAAAAVEPAADNPAAKAAIAETSPVSDRLSG